MYPNPPFCFWFFDIFQYCDQYFHDWRIFIATRWKLREDIMAKAQNTTNTKPCISYICSTYIALARPATLQMFQSNGQHIHNLYRNPQPSAKQQSSGHLIIELWPPPFCNIYVKLLVQLLCWKTNWFFQLFYICAIELPGTANFFLS